MGLRATSVKPQEEHEDELREHFLPASVDTSFLHFLISYCYYYGDETHERST